MSTVVMHNVVSVDGFIADADDQVGPLFDWYANGDTELVEGGTLKVSQASAEYVLPCWPGVMPPTAGGRRGRRSCRAAWPGRACRRRPRLASGLPRR